MSNQIDFFYQQLLPVFIFFLTRMHQGGRTSLLILPVISPVCQFSAFISCCPWFWLTNYVSPPQAPYSTLLSPGQGGRKHREHGADSILYFLLNHWVHSISPFPVYLLQTHIFFLQIWRRPVLFKQSLTITWLGIIPPLLCFPSQTKRKQAATFS